MIDSWTAFELFPEPFQIPSSKKGKLLTVGDSFFNEFEDGVYLGIINAGDQVLVHFLVSEKDEKRRAMYRGFIYGYFAEEVEGEL